jgi:hypothetical protein
MGVWRQVTTIDTMTRRAVMRLLWVIFYSVVCTIVMTLKDGYIYFYD